MNKKNNILEDLNRIHLLMNYNSKQTLTENESKLPKMAINESKLISEQKAVGQRIFGALLPGETAASAIAKKATATGAQKKVFDMLDDVARAVSMSGDDLITKLGSGAISGKKLSQVKQAFLLSTRGSTQFKDEILNLAVTGAKNNRGVSAAIARNASEAELVAAVKAMGYTDDAIATQIAKKLAPSATNQASKNMIQRFLSAGWEGIKNNWKTILAVVGASTALYYLYKYFNRKDITSLPMCIKKKAMEDEILEMANNGFDYINIGVIGNAEIDAMGGAKFWLDGNVVQLPNGDEGNWKVVGRRLTISAAGKTYDIECLDFDGGGGNTGGGGGVPIIPTPPSKYNNCINFPMAMYCSSDKIREVQNCLGITADGKFGPQTRNALKSSGYGDGTILTKQYYDAIMKNCGKEGSPNIPGPEDEFTPTFITPTEWLDQK